MGYYSRVPSRNMKAQLFLAGLLVISAFAAPVQEFDEDCVEEMDTAIEEIEDIQIPEIEPAIAEPDMMIFNEMGGDYQESNEEDCEEEFQDYAEPTPAPMEEEEQAPLPISEDIAFGDYEFAQNYDEGNIIISDDVNEIESDECDELEAEDVGFAEDFGFNIEAGNIQESDYEIMHGIEEENEAVEIEECEE